MAAQREEVKRPVVYTQEELLFKTKGLRNVRMYKDLKNYESGLKDALDSLVNSIRKEEEDRKEDIYDRIRFIKGQLKAVTEIKRMLIDNRV